MPYESGGYVLPKENSAYDRTQDALSEQRARMRSATERELAQVIAKIKSSDTENRERLSNELKELIHTCEACDARVQEVLEKKRHLARKNLPSTNWNTAPQLRTNRPVSLRESLTMPLLEQVSLLFDA